MQTFCVTDQGSNTLHDLQDTCTFKVTPVLSSAQAAARETPHKSPNIRKNTDTVLIVSAHLVLFMDAVATVLKSHELISVTLIKNK